MCCDKCRRVVPAWRMLGRMPMKTGCVCGCTKTWAAHIPEWQAAWWLLIRGRFIRKILLRKENWDPRIPMRELELPQ